MRHRVQKHHFNRDSKHRTALLKNLLRALIEHGSIVTTTAKAKEVKKLVDKLITKAKENSLSAKRQLHAYFGKRDVVNTLVEKIVPLASERQSGYTVMVNLGKRRGDNAQLAKLSLINMPENLHTLKAPESVKAEKAPKKKIAKPAAKVVKEQKKSEKTVQKSTTKTAAKKSVKKSDEKKPEKKQAKTVKPNPVSAKSPKPKAKKKTGKTKEA
jgi:large subunit ribosomal protein L17